MTDPRGEALRPTAAQIEEFRKEHQIPDDGKLESWAVEHNMVLAFLCAPPSHARAVAEWHDRLGSMIDGIGYPDYSLKDLIAGLRQLRDEMLATLPADLPQRLGDRLRTLLQAPQPAWCDCEPKQCRGEGLTRCRWHAMGYTPLPATARSEPLAATWGKPVYLVGGKPHRMCDCSNLENKCPRGVDRALQTAGFNQCLVPVEDVVITTFSASETAPSGAAKVPEAVAIVARAVNLGGQGMCILDAPCVFCGYNGAGYWQAGTHRASCPFHGVGGDASRADHITRLVAAPSQSGNEEKGK